METTLSIRDKFTVFFGIPIFYLFIGSHATVILMSIQDRAISLSLFILAISLIATWLWTKVTVHIIRQAYANIESHSSYKSFNVMCHKEADIKNNEMIPLWQRVICGVFALLVILSFYISPPSDVSFSWSNAYTIFKFLAAVVGVLAFAYFALVGKLPKQNSRERKNT